MIREHVPPAGAAPAWSPSTEGQAWRQSGIYPGLLAGNILQYWARGGSTLKGPSSF